MLTLCKGLLFADVLGLVYVAQVGPLLDEGERLGRMTSSEILGIVAVALVLAVLRLYTLKERASAQIADLVRESTAAQQRGTDAIKTQSDVMVEHKDATRNLTEAVNSLRRHCQDRLTH